MDALVHALVDRLERTRVLTNTGALSVSRVPDGYRVELEEGSVLDAACVVVAVPAFVAAELLEAVDAELASAHAEIPHASSVIVTLAFREDDVPHPLDGYGYVVPRVEGSDVLACTWTSRKWEGRAPAGNVLVRVYAGRFGGRDLTRDPDDDLLALAREELSLLGIRAEPVLSRVQRWPRGMPQYVLGHPERLARIEEALEAHPGLALAGSAYRGVGLPDCIRSGEVAAETVARALGAATAATASEAK
jgi:oxygen-dependent protoporphyrinogen oxidase